MLDVVDPEEVVVVRVDLESERNVGSKLDVTGLGELMVIRLDLAARLQDWGTSRRVIPTLWGAV